MLDSYFALKDEKLYSCFGIDFFNDLYDNGTYSILDYYTQG